MWRWPLSRLKSRSWDCGKQKPYLSSPRVKAGGNRPVLGIEKDPGVALVWPSPERSEEGWAKGPLSLTSAECPHNAGVPGYLASGLVQDRAAFLAGYEAFKSFSSLLGPVGS